MPDTEPEYERRMLSLAELLRSHGRGQYANGAYEG